MSFRGKKHELITGVLMFHASFHTFQDRAHGSEERLYICEGSISEDAFDQVICHPASRRRLLPKN